MKHGKTLNRNFRAIRIVPIILAGFLISCDPVVSDDIPEDYSTLQALIDEGFALFETGDLEEAIDRFKQALERDVDPSPEASLRAYQGLGWSYARLNRPASAISNFSFILSIENVISGRIPVVKRDNVATVLRPHLLDTTIIDSFGIGPWAIDLDTADYLLAVSSISSYGAQYKTALESGARRSVVAGTDVINVGRGLISDQAGLELGTPLESSLVFSRDTLSNPVSEPDSIKEYSDYYLDIQSGDITIKPRYWQLDSIEVEFKYYEKEYLPRSLTSHTVALQDAVTDDDFPILKPDQYPGGDVFLVSGEFFNHSGGTGGGTKNMLDAYAGIAVALSLQDDNLATVRACRIALLISQYIAETEEGYSYERLLYDGDSGVGVWELTFLMAEAYINMKDYRNIISALECLGASEVLDEASGSFIYDAYRILEGLEKPDTWSMGAIW